MKYRENLIKQALQAYKTSEMSSQIANSIAKAFAFSFRNCAFNHDKKRVSKLRMSTVNLLLISGLITACSAPMHPTPSALAEFSHALPNRQIEPFVIQQRQIEPAVIYFANDSDFVQSAEHWKLAEFVQQFTNQSWKSLVVEGHTDWNQSDTYNQSLSERRTHSVKLALANLGYPIEQMREVAKGEAFPVASNATPAGRQLNRRVEVRVYYPIIAEDTFAALQQSNPQTHPSINW
ncbi:MAG: OmpA family protein [Pseudomonadota bacterium]